MYTTNTLNFYSSKNSNLKTQYCNLSIEHSYLIRISLWIILKMFMYDGEETLQRDIVHMHVHSLCAMRITLLKKIISE